MQMDTGAVMEESSAVVVRARWATNEELEHARPLFERYYKQYTLRQVMEIMESEHGIKATSAQQNPQRYLLY